MLIFDNYNVHCAYFTYICTSCFLLVEHIEGVRSFITTPPMPHVVTTLGFNFLLRSKKNITKLYLCYTTTVFDSATQHAIRDAVRDGHAAYKCALTLNSHHTPHTCLSPAACLSHVLSVRLHGPGRAVCANRVSRTDAFCACCLWFWMESKDGCVMLVYGYYGT